MVYLRIKNASEAYYPRYLEEKYERIETGEHAGKYRFVGWKRPEWKDKTNPWGGGPMERVDLKRRYRESRFDWYLYLVRSVRQNGKVRQENVEYLGGVEKWGLKDLFWLVTGTTAFLKPWNSDYNRIKPFSTIQGEYGKFDISKATCKLVQRVEMAPCVIEKLIGEGVSFPFPKTFFKAFDEYGALFPILRLIETTTRAHLRRGYHYLVTPPSGFPGLDPKVLGWEDGGQERAEEWLNEWLPNVVSSVTGLRYTLQQEANE